MFYIETSHLPGDPFCQVRRTGSSPQARVRASRFGEFNKIQKLLLDADFALLRLVSQRNGVTTIEDTAVLSHTPLIFVDNTAAAERVSALAEIPDRGTVGGNFPTLSELRDAFKKVQRRCARHCAREGQPGRWVAAGPIPNRLLPPAGTASPTDDLSHAQGA